MLDYDVVVIGAGSGGIGAALSAGKYGLRTLLVEKNNEIGGNAAVSGVSVWEMGAGGTGVPFDIYKRLKKVKNAVGIYEFNRHCAWKNESGESQFPAGADLTIAPNLKYIDSLRRFGSGPLASSEEFVRKYWHGVPFEPNIYQHIVEEMIKEYPKIDLLKNTSFVKADYVDGQVISIKLSNQKDIRASYYIDATDDGHLSRACGGEILFGQESRSMFKEPSAPLNPTKKLNGVSLIFRISSIDRNEVQPLPDEIPSECWWASKFPLTSLVQYPNGDYNVNMLPTMSGEDFYNWSNKDLTVYEECIRRSLAHWHNLQTNYPMFRSFKIISRFISLGVRETHRVRGEYVLTENDLAKGLEQQGDPDIIAISDHPMDVHEEGRSGCTELDFPYGIPYRCLVPKGFKNMLMASRAASFSSIAASSCRLSRTMMQLGQAAGTAIYLANRDKVNVMAVAFEELRSELKKNHVQLEWPMSNDLREYIEKEQ
ncbi:MULTISPECIES: FAD-dependent oxidoreductase [unclassified Arenibacter]|uniref:FAD-dependent oxidoreductase n=1 Tax=unclassified Arenibacter TaxID=2615047 RepID=UPI000E35540E|nr:MULTISPECIES: FAD-dependent oxidoreductase [unclassified Arenibacter]MCM4164619.1 hypothetical protein [Arenibacter sp. A80]RFT55700.1 FAD-dependent oxidoreductase [Arenibacter sp. P308M17]